MNHINTNQQHKDGMSIQEKIGYFITKIVGTMWFFYILVLWQTGWMLWQSTTRHPFDAYPYPFLLFCSNIIQLIFLPILAVGNNVLNKRSELKADEDYKTNVDADQKLTALNEKIDRLLLSK